MARLDRVLWQLLGASRGGPTRIRILRALDDRPWNTNQLAERLGHDYKTIQHHIRMLKRHRLIDEQGTGEYGSVFFWTRDMQESREAFDTIRARLKEDA